MAWQIATRWLFTLGFFDGVRLRQIGRSRLSVTSPVRVSLAWPPIALNADTSSFTVNRANITWKVFPTARNDGSMYSMARSLSRRFDSNNTMRCKSYRLSNMLCMLEPYEQPPRPRGCYPFHDLIELFFQSDAAKNLPLLRKRTALQDPRNSFLDTCSDY